MLNRKPLLVLCLCLLPLGCSLYAETPAYDPLRCPEGEKVLLGRCTTCPPGSTNEAGDAPFEGDTLCDPVLCAENEYVRNNECLRCPAGTSRMQGDNATSADTACAPTLCRENERVVSNQCVACEDGGVSAAGADPSLGDTLCGDVLCGVDEYVSGNACMTCPPGTQNQPGDVVPGKDTTCDAIFCKENERVVSNACVPCGRLESNEAGDDASGGDTLCESFTCARDQRVESQKCVPCTKDKINEAGDPVSGPDTFCEPVFFKDVSVGYYHSCAITGSGGVMCWGDNGSGSLGVKGIDTSSVPVKIEGIPDRVVDLGVGLGHSCALNDKKEVFCWGRNNYFQLGIQSSEDKFEPVKVEGLPENVRKLSVGESYSCVLTDTHEVWCWGDGREGELGDGGSNESKAGIVKVEGLMQPILGLSTSATHACVMYQNQTDCWGSYLLGDFGPSEMTRGNKAMRSQFLEDAVAIYPSTSNMCYMKVTGEVLCFGLNSYGVLGNGMTMSVPLPQETILTQGKIQHVDFGSNFACAIIEEQSYRLVECWGDNSSGTLGNGETASSLVPVRVSLGSDVVSLSTTLWHVCAVLKSGSIKCWGENGSGQLGNGTTTSSNVPVNVKIEAP